MSLYKLNDLLIDLESITWVKKVDDKSNGIDRHGLHIFCDGSLLETYDFRDKGARNLAFDKLHENYYFLVCYRKYTLR